MGRLEHIDGGNWEEFLRAPVAVLMLGKSDCEACAGWTDELTRFLDTDRKWTHVRFGKMLLDKGGLVAFKRAHPWIAELEVLPFNQIFVAGARSKSFAGGGVERLLNRLSQVVAH
ncbi:MAG: hypothetical protein HY271_17275 [Deltaproteobacteria bacterium]|nr:hypothetical protein [Deltaproteobacteria bacterium]